MDDKKLDDILKNMKIPQPDENAKKRAINLSMAEFQANSQKNNKNENNFQGLSFLARLMGKSNKQKRTDPMKKRTIYTGMATAMAVILVAGVTMQQSNFTFQQETQKSFIKTASESDQSHITDSQPLIAPADKLQSPNLHDERRNRAEMESPALPQDQYGRKEPNGQPKGDNARHNKSSTITPAPTSSVSPQRLAQIPESEGRASVLKEKKIAGDIAASPMVSMEYADIDQADLFSPQQYKDVGRDDFEDFKINPIKLVSEEPVSTFSIDVDTASYSFVRRQLNHGVLPQKDAIRVEEMINYFDYNYPLPQTREQPFQASVTVTDSPWAEGKKLMHIGIKGYDIDPAVAKPATNLVFLLDVSGSMNNQDKLPLVINSLKLLLGQLEPNDTVGIVVYAGAAGTVLEPTKVSDKGKIIAALDKLSAGGSTAGAQGIRLAYELAESNFNKEGVNRIILATDGDFNVGITDRDELQDFVERKRESGIFLSVLGFGQGNLNDHTMQVLAQNGNGVAAYIDNLNEARKVLVEEATSTLFPIAKDVKLQVEFNPNAVSEYRLIGYETRHLNREDFNNDKVDAGDIGAGHTVTAIYEFTPAGGPASMDELRYGKKAETKSAPQSTDEYAFLKIRYKLPNEDTSTLMSRPVTIADDMTSKDGKPSEIIAQEAVWATAVASFAQILKGGEYTGEFNYDAVIKMAQAAKGDDPYGYRAEFIQMVRLAKSAAAMQSGR